MTYDPNAPRKSVFAEVVYIGHLNKRRTTILTVDSVDDARSEFERRYPYYRFVSVQAIDRPTVPETDKREITYVMARNDRDGNPQRGWMVEYRDRSTNGQTGLYFVDESYEGFAALRNAGITDPTVSSGNIKVERITVSAYRFLKSLPSLAHRNGTK
jgi:hypothetical protein